MVAITFDTLKFVDTLEKAQLPRDQARAIAAAVRESQQSAEVATKADLRALEASTDSKFDLLRKDLGMLRSDIGGEMKLHRWLLNLLAACMGVVMTGMVSFIIKAYF